MFESVKAGKGVMANREVANREGATREVVNGNWIVRQALEYSHAQGRKRLQTRAGKQANVRFADHVSQSDRGDAATDHSPLSVSEKPRRDVPA